MRKRGSRDEDVGREQGPGSRVVRSPVSGLCQLPSLGAEATSFLATVLSLLMLGLTANSHFLADSFPTLQGAWKEALMPSLPPPLPSQSEVGGTADGSQKTHLGRAQDSEKDPESHPAKSPNLGMSKNRPEKGFWFAQGRKAGSPHATPQPLRGRLPRRRGWGGDAQPIFRTQGTNPPSRNSSWKDLEKRERY